MQKLTDGLVEAIKLSERDQFVFDTVLSGFAVRVTPAGARIFLAQATVDGRKVRTKVATHPEVSVSAARKLARTILDDMRAGRNPKVAAAARRQQATEADVTVADLADRWMAEVVRPKRKPRTVADYEQILDKRIKPLLGHIPVRLLTWAEVNHFHGSMAKTPRRANYVVSTLRALLNFAERVGVRPPHSNPCRGIEFFRERMRERFLSEPEIGKAAEAIATAERDGKIGPHAAAGLRLALLSGARSGEITAAKWDMVDWQRKVIRLPDSKTNQPRTVHLSDAAVEVIKTLPRVGPFLIAGAKHGKSYKNLSRAWMVAREYAGLDDVRLHDLRHSYASLAASRGVSLQMIGKLLGHKVVATTQRYAHLARDQVAAVNDDLGAAMAAAINAHQESVAPAEVIKLRHPRKPR